MRVDAFDFDLPEERIALRPLTRREEARLLVVKDKTLADQHIGDLPELLQPGDVVVVNNTKVIPAFLPAMRPARDRHQRTGPVPIDITLHKRLDANHWRVFAKPAKRLKEGDLLYVGPNIEAVVEEKGANGEFLLAFMQSGAELDSAIAEAGLMPLPPYIASKREIDAQDTEDYQTIYAQKEGAVAAPTAGLHFTDNLFAELKTRGVTIEELTLHVGAGTFLPVKAEDTAEHQMHSEWGEVSADVADRLTTAKKDGRRVVAVGTTALRLLESAATAPGQISAFSGDTDIFITPGYRFKMVDVLLTNFHLPRSTLFMLVSAFSGLERMKAAYSHAISKGYRFYSYGDACLLHCHDHAEKTR